MKIPRIIHFIFLVFKGRSPNIPEKWQQNLIQWKTKHPNFTIQLWDDSRADTFLKTYFPDYVNVYYSLKYDIQRTDMLRYCILYIYGGVYCDLDLIPKHNISNILQLYEVDDNIQVGLAEGIFSQDGVSNYFMFSKPRVKFWKRILKCIKKDISTHYYFKTSHVMYQSGPSLLTSNMKHYKNKIIIIPTTILDNCNPCNKNCTNAEFGYITNEHQNSWVTNDGKILKKIICSTYPLNQTPNYILVLILYIFIIVIMGLVFKIHNLGVKSIQIY